MMKRHSDSLRMRMISALLFLSFNCALGQVIDDFEGAVLHSKWHGDRDKFKLENGTLISNSSVAGDQFSIGRLIDSHDTLEFRFECHLDFPTSSVNFLELEFEGDRTSFSYKFGGTRDRIQVTVNDTLNILIPEANTERSQWYVRLILTDDKASFHFNETKKSWIFDSTLTLFTNPVSLSHFTIRIKQSTSSFFGKHSFDNLYIGPRIRDTVAPVIDSLILPDHHTIRLVLSEPIDTFRTPICTLSGSNLKVQFESSTTLIAFTEEAMLDDRHYELKVSGLHDIENNKTDTIMNFVTRIPVHPRKGDVIITELLTDPDPRISLPNTEYVELTNLQKRYLDLGKCRIQDIGSSADIGGLILPPFGSVVLCDDDDIGLFPTEIPVHGMGRLPSLNNSSDRIRLVDQNDDLLDEVEYVREAISPEWKRDGGWSMVMLDSTKHCLGIRNWAYSADPSGGDPGRFDHRSREPSEYGMLKLVRLEMLSTRSLRLSFGSPIKDYQNCSISESGSVLDELQIGISQAILKISMLSEMRPGSVYTLELIGIEDCIGRILDTTVQFGIPSDIHPGDIVINEILFNPKTGGADFVELRNNSAELKAISQLFFFDVDSLGLRTHWQAAVPDFLSIAPGQCVALSKDPEFIKIEYVIPTYALIARSEAIPSLPNDSGYVGIANLGGQIIDEFRYSEDMHALLLPDPKGCSLERIDPFQATNLQRNWTSASSHIHYATPGYENSQFGVASFKDELTIAPKILDIHHGIRSTQINVKHHFGNVAMHVFVFDEHGIIIKRIADGLLTGNESSWYWDGSTDSGILAPTGTYLIVAHCLSVNGDRGRWKGVIHLIR